MIFKWLSCFILIAWPQISLLLAQNIIALNDYCGLELNATKKINVLENDLYPEGTVLSIFGYTNNTQMTNPPRIVGGKEIEIHAPQQPGSDQIIYKLCFGGNCVSATLHIGVYPNNTIQAINDVYLIMTLEKKNFFVLVNDVGSNAASLTLLTLPRHGTAEIRGDKIEYAPESLNFAIDSMDYRICKAVCSSARVYVYGHNPVPPIIGEISVETTEGTPYQFLLSEFLQVYEDPLRKPLSQIHLVSLPKKGTLVLDQKISKVDTFIVANDLNRLVYQPDSGFGGSDSFEWKAVSGARISNTSQVSIKVIPALKELIVYEGFSPNGDSLNDRWIIDGIEDHAENQVKIFNRYGILVFETLNYDNFSRVWSGETNVNHFNTEHLAPDDVYYYLIRTKTGKSLKGTVALKR